jgi:hypothetical protein
MIDPITIGIAFATAQKTVGYIKQAVALGKDVNSLYKQFGSFFANCDTVHGASAELKIKADGSMLTDGQIKAQALQIAMHSKALREAEKELKDLLIWSGNKDVWDEMMAERVRMYKERAAAEKKHRDAIAKAHADMVDRVLIGTSMLAISVPAVLGCLTVLTRV